MKYKYTLLLLLALCSVQFVIGQHKTRTYLFDKSAVARPHSVDFTHLTLDLLIVPEKKKVSGAVTEKFTVLQREVDTLFIDGIRMDYKKVLLNGKEVPHKKTNNGLTFYFEPALTWNSEHEIYIEYEATPGRGMYFIGWDDSTGRSRKQIWTQGQGINNRHWVPMFDERNDKLVTEILIEFDEEYKVLSNGLLLEKKAGSTGKTKWHYKISARHSPYLMMLGIGKYEIESTKSKSGIPMHFYYYPNEREKLKPTYLHSVEMFEYFEKEIGVPFPWKTYAQIPVQNYMYGAMENTTATIFGDFYLGNSREFLDRNYIRVNAHELAHQWFGDMITARSSAHHWLQESFATHYDMVYQGVAFGEDHFDALRRNYNDQSIKASLRDLKPLAHSEAGTVRHYPKGALVLQMLKYVVGREQYNVAVQSYLERYAYECVNSDDLLVAFHERLGLSLDWFWEEWVYKGGEPHYEVRFEAKRKQGIFEVYQIHEKNELVGNFKMPINFELHFRDGSVSKKKVWVENDTTVVTFDLEKKKVEYVLFDPNSELIKSVTFNKPVSMLKAQARKAKSMLDRYDAYVALDSIDFQDKDKFLAERFYKEKFHLTKNELLEQLCEDNPGFAEDFLLKGISDPSVDVRKGAIRSTRKIAAKNETEYLKLLNDSSYVIISDALELLTINFPEKAESYLELTKNEMGNSSKNVRITWLKIAYLVKGKNENIKELVDYSSNAFEFLTRINAMNALKDINYLDIDALNSMLEASSHFNGKLRNTARGAVDFFAKQEKYKQLISDRVVSGTWRASEEKRLKKYILE